MLGIRDISSAKVTSLILIIILILTLVLAKNSQAVMRAMVGQEISLRTAGFSETQTEHFIIKYTPVDEEYIDTIASASEKSYTEVTQLFGYTPAQKTVIVVYPDTVSLAKSFGWDKDEKAMGVYWAGSIRILSPSQWVTGKIDDEFYKDGPMVHEFAHLLVDDITKGNYNRWWTEGIAQYVEKKITGFQFTQPQNKSVEYYEFKELDRNFDQLDQGIAYWQSLKAAEFIADNYGEDMLFVILENLAGGNSVSQAIEKALGISFDTFANSFYHVLTVPNTPAFASGTNGR